MNCFWQLFYSLRSDVTLLMSLSLSTFDTRGFYLSTLNFAHKVRITLWQSNPPAKSCFSESKAGIPELTSHVENKCVNSPRQKKIRGDTVNYMFIKGHRSISKSNNSCMCFKILEVSVKKTIILN